ncbi:protein encoded within IS [Shigella boydii]|nr:protein encoded within IS [Shigella boydii]
MPRKERFVQSVSERKTLCSSAADHGGERGALLYGLIGTCRLNGIDPEAICAIS